MMNKSDLTNNLFKKHKLLSKIDVEVSVNLILNNISNALCNGNRVELRGFGSFSTRIRSERISRNPKTGKSISVHQKRHPYFRAAEGLKETIKN